MSAADDDDRPLTELERQGVDSGTTVFDTEEEMRAAEAEFLLEHEAVLAAVGQPPGEEDESDVDDDDAPDLDDYDDLLEE